MIRYATAALAVGQAGQALALLTEAAAAHPLDEAVHAQLIAATTTHGDHTTHPSGPVCLVAGDTTRLRLAQLPTR